MEQKKKKNKLLLVGLGVVAVGTGGYFLYKHLEAKKNNINSTSFQQNSFVPESILPSLPSTPKIRPAGFPLKRGSKGALVKQIQTALINKYGNGILPRFGADGDFGSETEKALRSKNLPSFISPETFALILKTNGSSNNQALLQNNESGKKSIAKGLHAGILRDNFQQALAELRKIKNVNSYSAVSSIFKLARINGVRKSIVNALLTRFSSSNEKKQLNSQFSKMGLKYNGSQWSLNGLNGLSSQVITTKPCKVWNVYGESMLAEEDTILGTFLSTGNGITEFSTIDDQILFTNTSCIAFT